MISSHPRSKIKILQLVFDSLQTSRGATLASLIGESWRPCPSLRERSIPTRIPKQQWLHQGQPIATPCTLGINQGASTLPNHPSSPRRRTMSVLPLQRVCSSSSPDPAAHRYNACPYCTASDSTDLRPNAREHCCPQNKADSSSCSHGKAICDVVYGLLASRSVAAALRRRWAGAAGGDTFGEVGSEWPCRDLSVLRGGSWS